jgi:hypothetical protein
VHLAYYCPYTISTTVIYIYICIYILLVYIYICVFSLSNLFSHANSSPHLRIPARALSYRELSILPLCNCFSLASLRQIPNGIKPLLCPSLLYRYIPSILAHHNRADIERELARLENSPFIFRFLVRSYTPTSIFGQKYDDMQNIYILQYYIYL